MGTPSSSACCHRSCNVNLLHKCGDRVLPLSGQVARSVRQPLPSGTWKERPEQGRGRLSNEGKVTLSLDWHFGGQDHDFLSFLSLSPLTFALAAWSKHFCSYWTNRVIEFDGRQIKQIQAGKDVAVAENADVTPALDDRLGHVRHFVFSYARPATTQFWTGNSTDTRTNCKKIITSIDETLFKRRPSWWIFLPQSADTRWGKKFKVFHNQLNFILQILSSIWRKQIQKGHLDMDFWKLSHHF